MAFAYRAVGKSVPGGGAMRGALVADGPKVGELGGADVNQMDCGHLEREL